MKKREKPFVCDFFFVPLYRNMSKASLHNCGSCDHSSENDGGDCASCKLASLVKASKELKERQERKERQSKGEGQDERFRIDDDEELSISERLTENGSDHTILYMVLMAAMLFALVVIFSKMFS